MKRRKKMEEELQIVSVKGVEWRKVLSRKRRKKTEEGCD